MAPAAQLVQHQQVRPRELDQFAGQRTGRGGEDESVQQVGHRLELQPLAGRTGYADTVGVP